MNYLPQTIKYKIEVYFSDEGKHDLTMHNMKAAFPLASLPYNRKSDIKASETEDVLAFLMKRPIMLPKIIVCEQGNVKFLWIRHWRKLPVMICRLKEKGLDNVYDFAADNLRAIHCKVTGEYTHSCPKFFSLDAQCPFHDCNVDVDCERDFDMTAPEEEFIFMK